MNRQRWLVVLGALLVGVALAIPLSGEMRNVRAQRASNSILAQLNEVRPQLRATSSLDAYETGDGSMPVVQIGSHDYVGSVVIPSLGIELPVAAVVDDGCLRECPCRYDGSYFNDDLIVCGEGYRSHFGNLGSLGIEDEVLFVSVDGAVYRYAVSNVETDSSKDVGAYPDDWDLTLFTLAGNGSYLVVRCVRVPNVLGTQAE